MCKCLSTSHELLEVLNTHRTKRGHQPVPYSWLMIRLRKELTFILPARMVGRNFMWDSRSVKTIVKLLEAIPYRRNTFRWSEYLKVA